MSGVCVCVGVTADDATLLQDTIAQKMQQVSLSITGLPLHCLERVLGHLDFISAFLLSCSCRFFRAEALTLWGHRHDPPTMLRDMVADNEHALAQRFARAAQDNIEQSPLFTSSPCFEMTSVIPKKLTMRHAIAALDLACLLPRVAPVSGLPPSMASPPLPRPPPPDETPPVSLPQRDDDKRAPAPKLTPFQVALVCRSTRVLDVMLHEPRASCRDSLLLGNADGQMPALDLNVKRLPNAHLGRYTKHRMSNKTGRQSARQVTASRRVGVRMSEASGQSRVYAKTSYTDCVNTTWLLELAILLHEPSICEMLCHQTSMHVPTQTIAQLFSPRATRCTESLTRFGAEYDTGPTTDSAANGFLTKWNTSSPDDAECVRGPACVRAMSTEDPPDSDSETGQNNAVCMSVCEHLGECPYVTYLLRILQALVRSGRIVNWTLSAAHCAADFGDLELLHELACAVGMLPATAADIKDRLAWRIMYDTIKIRRIGESRARYAPFKLPVYFHSCVQRQLSPVHSETFQKATAFEMETQIFPYAFMIRSRRAMVIESLSRG